MTSLAPLDFLLTGQPAPQARQASFEWTYVWLGLGGLLLVLMVLAFGYLLVRRRGAWLWGLVRPSAFGKVDRFFTEHMPRAWAVIRRRFDVRQGHGLALTVAVLVVFVAGYLFALITESWTDEAALYALDRRVYEWLIGATGEQVVAVMDVVTWFGGGLVVTLVSVAIGSVLLVRRHRWDVVALGLSVGAGAAVMHGLKWAFERSRPFEPAAEAAGHAFPSGHSFLAVVLYGFVIYLAWRHSQRDAVRLAITIVLTLLIVLVGLSRILLRVHWVSDVAGGFTVGLAWLIVSLIATRSLEARRSRSAEAAEGA